MKRKRGRQFRIGVVCANFCDSLNFSNRKKVLSCQTDKRLCLVFFFALTVGFLQTKSTRKGRYGAGTTQIGERPFTERRSPLKRRTFPRIDMAFKQRQLDFEPLLFLSKEKKKVLYMETHLHTHTHILTTSYFLSSKL